MPTTPLPATVDSRPRTAVLLQWVGMGDLVWHVPYFRRVAETSRGGQAALIASPTVFANQLVGHEPWIERYNGPAVGPYEDATSFAIGHFSKPLSR